MSFNFTPKAKKLYDVFLILLIIICLFLVNISKVLAQCNCNDELVLSTSLVSSDDFESYNSNQPIPLQGNWTLFPAQPNYSPIAATVVSSPVDCGSRALRFQYSGQPVDMRYAISDSRTSFKMYVPFGKSAKFSYLLLNGETEHFNVIFNSNGTATISTNGQSFDYPQGNWFRFSAYRTGNEFKIFLEYDHVASIGSISTAGYANFYAHEAGNQFYIDKICNTEYNNIFIQCTQEYEPRCLNLSNIEVGSNDCWAMAAGYLYEEHYNCGGINDSPCSTAEPLPCGDTKRGNTLLENFKFYRPDYSSCFENNSANDYRAPDKVYEINHPGGDAQFHMFVANHNIDLDLFLLDKCESGWSGNPEIVIITTIPPNETNPDIHCIAKGTSYIDQDGYDTEYIYYKNLPAGTYYLVVDGQHWQESGQINDAGEFDISYHCNDVGCANIPELKCGLPLLNQTNVASPNNSSIYCYPPISLPSGSTLPLPDGAGCTGPERVYKFIPTENGKVTIEVTGIEAFENFELIILSSCNHDDCVATSTNYYGQQESVTFDAVKGQTYYVVVDGYQGSVGTFNIEAKCANDKLCDECLQCFKYKPRYNGAQTIEFISGWCNNQGGIPLNYTYNWEFDTQEFELLDNTSVTSENPVCTFKNNGKYRICQKIYNGSTLVYTCCQTIDIKPCFNEPIANYSAVYNASDGSFSLDASMSQNIDNIEWKFSDSDVEILQGNITSPQCKIRPGFGKCVNVCVYVNNGCGVSQYCTRICRGNNACAGSVPPILFINTPIVGIDGRKITINAPTLPNAVYTWDPGDGTQLKSGATFSHTYAKDGNYLVCLRVVVGCRLYCFCFGVKPKLCPPSFEIAGNTINVEFTGNNLINRYRFITSNLTVANYDWLLNNIPIKNSVGKTSMEFNIPKHQDNTICVPYLKPNGCVAYKCIVIPGIPSSVDNSIKNSLETLLIPNPASDLLTIKTNFDIISLEIIDYKGSLMHKQFNLQQIDVSYFSPGFYNAIIRHKHGFQTRKFLIIK